MPRAEHFRQHDSVFARLMANVVEETFVESLGPCWCGTERDLANYGYCRSSLWVPSLPRSQNPKKLLAHILVFCIQELRKIDVHAPTNDELYLAYLEFRASGLEIDHKCNVPACRRPDHLQPATRHEQEQFKHERRMALPVVNIEHDPCEVEF